MRRFSSLSLSVLAVGGWVCCAGGTRVQAREGAKKNSVSERNVMQGSRSTKPDIGGFYLRLGDEDRRAFLKKVQTIKVGDTRKNVETLLGEPGSDDRVTTKEKRKFIGRFVTYYLTMYRKDLVSEDRDEWIMFRFGNDDKLVSVSSRVHDVVKQ